MLVYLRENGKLRIKINDFGFSKEMENGIFSTNASRVGLSPGYIPPEI